MNNIEKSLFINRQFKKLAQIATKVNFSLGKAFKGTCWKANITFLEDEILITVTSETQKIEFILLHGKLLRGGVVPAMLQMHQDEIKAIIENWLEAEDE